MKLKNKIALITGTSAGIGKKCVMELAKRGIHLVLLARRYEKLEKLKKNLSRIIWMCLFMMSM